MKRTLFLFVYSVVFLFGLGAAQNIQLPYLCDFEDDAENAKWTLNYNPNLEPGTLKNLWYIGEADASEGKKSMYVSSDGGATVSYTNSDNTILAWRVIELPKGTYDLAFDWLAYGEGTSAVYVAWMDSATKRVLSLTSMDLPVSISENALTFNVDNRDVTSLKNASVWQRATTQIVSDGVTKYKLVFAWNNSSAKPIPPGAAIDNIQIAKSSCEKPKNLKVKSKGSVATIRWESDADEFMLRYKRNTDTQWQTQMGIKQDSLVISGLSNGVYDFWLRSICYDASGNDTGIWVLFPKVLVYDALCIDYLKIDSSNCTFGPVANPEQNKGILDFGYATVRSRHTVHFLPGERDPRTNGVLKTIPEGEIASVRLGSWDNAHAETATYEYLVDTVVAQVLMLKYAIVFQDPNHPNKKDQPHVQLQIFDENGNEVNPSCAGADFYAKAGVDGWVTIENGDAKVVWKDWTTLGLNLEGLHGQKIKIKVSVAGCTFSAHYAYLYFTLGCTSGKLEGINCGETPTTQFIAPEGFNYRWYKAFDDPTTGVDERGVTLCDSIVFDVDPNDTTTYKVDVIYPEDANCYFTLKANAIPRFPKAQAEYDIEVKDCQSIVKFKSTSYIYTQDRITGELGTSEDPVETLYWNFGNGQTSMSLTPEVKFPNDGREHEVMLVAGLCNNLCSDTVYLKVQMPLLKDTVVHVEEQICKGEIYNFVDTTLTTEGEYVRTIESWGGCDSTIILNLTVLDKYYTDIYDTICESDSYVFGGDTLYLPGVYVDSLISDKGCDSIVTLYLEQIKPLWLDLHDDNLFACSDDNELEISYDLPQGDRLPIAYSVRFNRAAQDAGFVDVIDVVWDSTTQYIPIQIPLDCRPNRYGATLTLKDQRVICGDEAIDVVFDVYYSTSILEVKFGNLITVYDSVHNGGYSFVDYQWYKNDSILEGEVESFFYLPEGEVFDKGDCYYLMAKRVDDGVVTRTCEICPTVFTSVEDVNDEVSLISSTLVDPLADIVLEHCDKADVKIYTLAGVLVDLCEIDSDNRVIKAPSESGFYLLHIESNNRRVVYKIKVK